MGFLRRWLGGSGERSDSLPSGSNEADEAEWRVSHEASFDAYADRQRVTVWLRLVDPEFGNEREQQRVFGLEDRLMRGLDGSGAGEHDTNSLEAGYLAVRLIGDDADAIVSVVLPLLFDAPPGSYLAVRRGPAGTGEDRVDLVPEDEPAAAVET